MEVNAKEFVPILALRMDSVIAGSLEMVRVLADPTSLELNVSDVLALVIMDQIVIGVALKLVWPMESVLMVL